MSDVNHTETFIKMLGTVDPAKKERGYYIQMEFYETNAIKLATSFIDRKKGKATIAVKDRIIFIKTTETIKNPRMVRIKL